MALRRWTGRAIGLDVHRDFCVVAICEDGQVRSGARVPSTPEGLNLRITLTGSGTFHDGPECSRKVTGGGTWTITPGTAPTPPAGSGTYRVVHFVSWTPAPGTLPVADCIGEATDVVAGRLTLTIRFSDGSEGVLEIGCRLPAGSPDEIMEGITVTKGFATFWNHEEPVAGVEGNRTLFHLLRKHDDDDD
jgi:hypothetical protein